MFSLVHCWVTVELVSRIWTLCASRKKAAKKLLTFFHLPLPSSSSRSSCPSSWSSPLKVQAFFGVYDVILGCPGGSWGVFGGTMGSPPTLIQLCVSQSSRPPTLSPNFAVAGTHALPERKMALFMRSDVCFHDDDSDCEDIDDKYISP